MTVPPSHTEPVDQTIADSFCVGVQIVPTPSLMVMTSALSAVLAM